MRKSTIIAQSLVNSNMIRSLEDAENRVRGVFEDEFPGQNFAGWNTEVDANFAAQKIKNVGVASRINVRRFIDDLR